MAMAMTRQLLLSRRRTATCPATPFQRCAGHLPQRHVILFRQWRPPFQATCRYFSTTHICAIVFCGDWFIPDDRQADPWFVVDASRSVRFTMQLHHWIDQFETLIRSLLDRRTDSELFFPVLLLFDLNSRDSPSIGLADRAKHQIEMTETLRDRSVFVLLSHRKMWSLSCPYLA
ncbi:hypothetical protein M6B38_115105 [Iris pallida]|uniref:Uncharacterized protein n=1 Tax=Iris pallida TaxID=29817 RepID=A0AAX6I4B0_IRIPA|nr:hypothetical protein M6B38_115105 [Iris pallida]